MLCDIRFGLRRAPSDRLITTAISLRGVCRRLVSNAALGEIPVPNEKVRPGKDRQRSHQAIQRLLAARSPQSAASYESLPCLFEAPDLQTNPHLASLVTPIDARLLAPLYNDIDRNNGGLTFFTTGAEHNPGRNHYVRAFMPTRTEGSPQGKSDDSGHESSWQALAKLLTGVFASVGVTEFRDFYTHVLPPSIGRHLPHKDQLQSDTWKVDIRFSPNPTELLVLDEVDRRWYALRFPSGASGFVIDSKMFSYFHAVLAGSTIQQSVLAVFHKQGSTLEMVREAFARRSAEVAPVDCHITELKPFALPLALTRHPQLDEAARVGTQAGKHFHNCLELLRNAVRKVDPLSNKQRLSRVPRSVIDRAIETLAPDLREYVLGVYRGHCKLQELAHYGPRVLTAAAKRGYVEVAQKNQRVIDDRFVSIHGTVAVGDKTLHFHDYDGTRATLLRFAWTGRGDRYVITAKRGSLNDNTRNLAVLLKKLNERASSFVYLDVLEGDQITGQTASLLRAQGLELRVVPLVGELDSATKRVRERARPRQLKGVQQSTADAKALGSPPRPRSAYSYFFQHHSQSAKKSFAELSLQEKQVYENKAMADRDRYDRQLLERATVHPESDAPVPKSPQKPRSAWVHFVKDRLGLATGNPSERLLSVKRAFDQLSNQELQDYRDKAQSDRSRYETELSAWRVATSKGPVLPRSAWSFFVQDKLKLAPQGTPSERLRFLGKEFTQLRPDEKQVYEDNAKVDLHRYQKEVSSRRSAKPILNQIPPLKRPQSAWDFYFLQAHVKSTKKAFDELSPQDKQIYEDKANADRGRYQMQLLEWRAAHPVALPVTAYEMFRKEMSPILLKQEHPDNYLGQEGHSKLQRDLKSEWQRQGQSAWLLYDQQAQRELGEPVAKRAP